MEAFRMTVRLNGLALGLGMVIAASALPAAAQSWPTDAGPTSDFLGSVSRQFDRLDPPTVEREDRRAERAIPGMPLSDVPVASPGQVEVGMPSVVGAAPPAAATPRQPRRQASRNASRNAVAARRSRDAGMGSVGVTQDEFRRELAERDRRIEELQRQLDQERRAASRASGGAGAGSGVGTLFGINPAAAATVTPR